MTTRLIYIGNLAPDTTLPIPSGTQCIAYKDGSAILQTEDLQIAQQVAQDLDGRSLNGRTITAIERTRLETALKTARTTRCGHKMIALATRLGLVKRDAQYCLQRLVALWGETPVLNAAEVAIQQAKSQHTNAAELFFSLLLGPLHPFAAQALRGGSLQKAENRPRRRTETATCQPLMDPVLIELERRKEVFRRARHDWNALKCTEGVDATKLAHAYERMNEADQDVKAFMERYDIPTTVHQFRRPRAIRARDITNEDL